MTASYNLKSMICHVGNHVPESCTWYHLLIFRATPLTNVDLQIKSTIFSASRETLLAVNPTMIASQLNELGPTLFQMLHALLANSKDDNCPAIIKKIGAACSVLLHFSNQRLNTNAVKATLFMLASGNVSTLPFSGQNHQYKPPTICLLFLPHTELPSLPVI